MQMLHLKLLTCLRCFKESNLLLRQSLKQLRFDFACESIDGTKKESSSAACTDGAEGMTESLSSRNSQVDPSGTESSLPSQGKEAHVQESSCEFTVLVVMAQDVNHPSSVVWDEGLT